MAATYRLAQYRSKHSGLRLSVCTLNCDLPQWTVANDIAHIEKNLDCVFLRWID